MIQYIITINGGHTVRGTNGYKSKAANRYSLSASNACKFFHTIWNMIQIGTTQVYHMIH